MGGYGYGFSYYFDNRWYSFSDDYIYEQKVFTCCEDEKKHYFLVISPFFILGTFFSFSLRSNHIGPF